MYCLKTHFTSCPLIGVGGSGQPVFFSLSPTKAGDPLRGFLNSEFFHSWQVCNRFTFNEAELLAIEHAHQCELPCKEGRGCISSSTPFNKRNFGSWRQKLPQNAHCKALSNLILLISNPTGRVSTSVNGATLDRCTSGSWTSQTIEPVGIP